MSECCGACCCWPVAASVRIGWGSAAAVVAVAVAAAGLVKVEILRLPRVQCNLEGKGRSMFKISN